MSELLPWKTRAFHLGVVLLNVVWLCMVVGIFVFPQTLGSLRGWFIVIVMLQATVPILSILVILFGQSPKR